jgi:hypothetical protein
MEKYRADMMRVGGVDGFRGLSIMLMVFFTLIIGLSDSLPDLLTHNQPFSLHLGDFVLPMFLFASGMSIVFFREKIAHLKPLERAFFAAERFSRVAVVWLFLSPFTGGGLFEMDEIMLSAVLFVPSYVLAGKSIRAPIAASLCCFALYFLLMWLGKLPDFEEHYLGGFQAAVFYLPVMLGGVMAGKKIGQVGDLLIPYSFLSAVLLLIVPPYKLSVTPSFIALSVAVCIAAYILFEKTGSGLQKLGKEPLKYWVLMALFIVVPLKLYAYYNGLVLPLGLGWETAVLMAIGSLFCLYLIKEAFDSLAALLSSFWVRK